MIDPLNIVRNAFLNALAGITHDTNPVNVYDEINPNNEPYYILLSSQTSTEISTFSSFDFDCTMLIDIVHKQGFSATKYVVDSIAQKVINRIKPTPSSHGLGTGAIHFSVVKIESDNHLSLVTDTDVIIRRLIRFSLKVNEKQ